MIGKLKREHLAAITKSKAILQRAEQEKRLRTAAEEEELKALDAELDMLERTLAEQEALEARTGRIHPELGEPIPALEQPGHRTPATGARFKDLRTGQEIRALLPHERVADAIGLAADQRELSIGRYLQGQITGKWDHAPAEKRLLQVGSVAAGGNLVPTPLSAQIIDLARARSTVMQLGAQTIPMTAPTLDLARITGDPTITWFGGDEIRATGIPESQGTFGRFQLQAQTGAFLERVSVELAEVPNFAQVIENQLGAAGAAAIDQYILYGTSGGVRDGLRTWITNDPTNSINEVTAATNGDTITTYAKFTSAAQKCLEGNVPLEPQQLGLLWAPRTWGIVAGLTEATTNAPLRGPSWFEAMRKLTSSAVKITETQGSSGIASTAFLGDFSQIAVGVLTDMNFEMSREAGDAFSRLHVMFRLYMRLDFVVLQPKFLTRMIGLIP